MARPEKLEVQLRKDDKQISRIIARRRRVSFFTSTPGERMFILVSSGRNCATLRRPKLVTAHSVQAASIGDLPRRLALDVPIHRLGSFAQTNLRGRALIAAGTVRLANVKINAR